MKKAICLVLLSVALLCHSNVEAQKAYSAVYYIGKIKNLTVRFMLADGYVAGCEINTTNATSKKRSVFLPQEGSPDENNQMKFYHYSTSGKTFTDYFIIDGLEEFFDVLPQSFTGTYYLNKQAYVIQLQKQN
jgi:hypothetical protein